MPLGAPERGVGKGGFKPLGIVRSASDGAAAMVEVQVGQEDIGDVVSVKSEGIQLKVKVLVARGVMAKEFLALLVAHAAVHQHQPVAILDEQERRAQSQRLRSSVGWCLVQRGFGHHAEHGAAVQLEQPWVTVCRFMPPR